MTAYDHPVRIFLAEDHMPDLILIKEALRTARISFALEHAEEGERAIRLLRSFDLTTRPQLIIVDINLPKKNGFEVITALRGNPFLADVPIMILTSSKSAQDQQRARELGIAAFVSKPPDLHEFLAAVGSAVLSILSSGASASGGWHRHRLTASGGRPHPLFCKPWRSPAARRASISR
jgi:CheY-like chemotaxis protein